MSDLPREYIPKCKKGKIGSPNQVYKSSPVKDGKQNNYKSPSMKIHKILPEEGDYGFWGEEHERIVYKDRDFVIMKYPASDGGFGYEVIPIDEKEARLDDMEICPEPDNFKDAIRMMEERRSSVTEYKKHREKRFNDVLYDEFRKLADDQKSYRFGRTTIPDLRNVVCSKLRISKEDFDRRLVKLYFSDLGRSFMRLDIGSPIGERNVEYLVIPSTSGTDLYDSRYYYIEFTSKPQENSLPSWVHICPGCGRIVQKIRVKEGNQCPKCGMIHSSS